nr:hypothetical protein [Bacteroidota bacterium]
MNWIINILWDTTVATFDIVVVCFGGLFLLGLLLYLLARYTRNLFAKTLGIRAELFISAWIGTPVHELGHAFFCVIFGHRITKIRMFDPNAGDGSLGSVEHSYNPVNFYQRAGSFFIGAGPIIFGSLVILILMYLLLPNSYSALQQFKADSSFLNLDGIGVVQYFGMISSGFSSVLRLLFSAENMGNWQFWVFLYLVMAIASHMELSPADLKGMMSGFMVILLLIFLVSLIYAIFIPGTVSFLYATVPLFNFLNQLLFMALLFSLINFILFFLIVSIPSLIIKGSIVNPFTR